MAYGPMAALDDRPRPGKEPTIPKTPGLKFQRLVRLGASHDAGRSRLGVVNSSTTPHRSRPAYPQSSRSFAQTSQSVRNLGLRHRGDMMLTVSHAAEPPAPTARITASPEAEGLLIVQSYRCWRRPGNAPEGSHQSSFCQRHRACDKCNWIAYDTIGWTNSVLIAAASREGRNVGIRSVIERMLRQRLLVGLAIEFQVVDADRFAPKSESQMRDRPVGVSAC